MANVQHLVNGAAKATGATIVAAGVFQPKGMAGKAAAGPVAGAALGDATGGTGAGGVGAATGIVVGTAAGAKGGGTRFVVALSDTKIYVVKPESLYSLHEEELELLHTFRDG